MCDETFANNPLVNVLCLGLVPPAVSCLAPASGEGNLSVLHGSSTGRHGIGGASVTSEGFGDDEAERASSPAVEVSDPFEG